MADLITNVERESNVLVVRAGGEITFKRAPDFHRQLTELRNGGVEHMILDLSGVSMIDSSGIGTLLRVYRDLQAEQGRLSVTGLHGQVKGVFEITRVDKVLGVFDSVDAARHS